MTITPSPVLSGLVLAASPYLATFFVVRRHTRFGAGLPPRTTDDHPQKDTR
jgi:hypothetical protein